MMRMWTITVQQPSDSRMDSLMGGKVVQQGGMDKATICPLTDSIDGCKLTKIVTTTSKLYGMPALLVIEY